MKRNKKISILFFNDRPSREKESKPIILSLKNLCTMTSEGITALVLGATGAIGKEVLREIINSPRIKHITVITRRELSLDDFKSDKIIQKVVDFENLNNHKDAFQGASIAFCCLGTTRGKAGAEGFVRVDKDYVYEAAKILKESGCSHFNLVTSKGSNKDSSMLYMKTKGEVESLVTDLEFSRLSIFRPSLLLCSREESRPFEKIAQMFAKGFDWRSKLSIPVENVAHAMIVNSLIEPTSKVEILEHNDINKLGID